jgi:hypothetical protein
MTIFIVFDGILYEVTHSLGTMVSDNRNANNNLLFLH